MDFQNLEQIRKTFEISDIDLAGIKSKLHQTILELHPDRHGGVFENADAQDQFNKAKSALKYVAFLEESKADLVPVQVAELVVKYVTHIQEHPPLKEYETTVANRVEFAVNDIHRKRHIPKLSMAYVSAALTAVWLLPNAITSNPLLKDSVDLSEPILRALWAASIILTMYLWILYALTDNAKSELTRQLARRRIQEQALTQFIRQIRTPKKLFSKNDLEIFLHCRFRVKVPYLLSRLEYDDIVEGTVIENTADLLLRRGLEKGFIIKDESAALEDNYCYSGNTMAPEERDEESAYWGRFYSDARSFHFRDSFAFGLALGLAVASAEFYGYYAELPYMPSIGLPRLALSTIMGFITWLSATLLRLVLGNRLPLRMEEYTQRQG